MDWFTNISWTIWLIAGVAAYFFGIPLLLLSTFKIEAKPTLQAVHPDELWLPPTAQDHFDVVEASLAGTGFETAGTVHLPCMTPNVISLVRVLVNRAARVSAMANSTFTITASNMGARVGSMPYVEFTTRYASGEEFNTLNPQVSGSFAKRANVQSFRLPWISDVKRLYEIHDAITAAKGPGGPKVLPLETKFGGDVVAFIQGCTSEELAQAAAAGYLRLTPDGTHYRMTLRGAYLMTWKQLPPIKQFINWRDRRRVESLLREIGIR